ncbi:MAG: DUF1192 domain-containing protein [Caulobacterales bacterium]|jgi:uncharacterized small protein (DUF1192 family)
MREDDFYTPKPAQVDGIALSAVAREALSIQELEARIVALQAEIAACEGAINLKRSQRSAADALFGGNTS